jgi:hypothetical protein
VAPLIPAWRLPYKDLRAEAGRRGRHDPEYDAADTGVFDDDRYWIVECVLREGEPGRPADVDADHERGPEPETLHVLPTAWFRNTGPGTPARKCRG